MAIVVTCVNTGCSAYQVQCPFPPEMHLGEGEQVLCGTCGNPTEFLEGESEVLRMEFNPTTMNRAVPSMKFKRGSLPKKE